MRIDLHVHSAASDGTDTPTQLVANAVDAGLDVIAMTDHDTVAGHAEAATAVRELAASGRRLTIVPGAEISCGVDDISLHLLGYLFDPSDEELAQELELLRTDRVRRAREMVERLIALGVPISWGQVAGIAGDAAVGRPHVARAMVEVGVVPDVSAAFVPEWIANDGRAYVDKYSLDPVRAIRLVAHAGGVSVLAHPAASSRGATVDTALIAGFADAGLDGVEVDHPDHDAATRAGLRVLAADLGLFGIGSSDYHGFVKDIKLGANVTHPSVYDALVARARGAQLIETEPT
jgi:predicted metal-dependent phosphoesterase TrpH